MNSEKELGATIDDNSGPLDFEWSHAVKRFTSLVVLAFLACGPVNNSTYNPTSKDYPCGTRGLACAKHMCCWTGDECGGFENGSVSCPSNMCCFVGDPSSSVVGSPTRPKQHPMTIETQSPRK